jgi:hypothetical protein
MININIYIVGKLKPMEHLHPMKKRCMQFYAMNYSIHPQSQFSINPPNHLITVFHCEIITRLLQRCQRPNILHQITRTCRRLT